MTKIEEMDKLDKDIKNADISLKSIQCHIEQVDKEISALGPRKHDLEQNIEFHKMSGTVPLAHEYKKAKKELLQIKARLIMITNDRRKAKEACSDIELIIERYKREYAKLLESGDNNVVRVRFGGRNGKN